MIHRLGIRIVEVRDGRIAATAPLAGNLNYQDSMYAGTLFGLGEAPLARWYSRPTSIDSGSAGDADFVLDAQLTDSDGSVVATTHGTYQVRRL